MDNPVCDICGGKLVEIKPKITKRLVYVPSQLYVEKTVVHQYVCHECSEREETMYIFQKEGYVEPRPLLKGSWHPPLSLLLLHIKSLPWASRSTDRKRSSAEKVFRSADKLSATGLFDVPDSTLNLCFKGWSRISGNPVF